MSSIPGRSLAGLALAVSLFGCVQNDAEEAAPGRDFVRPSPGPVAFRGPTPRAAFPLSVASMDRASAAASPADELPPVEARFLVVAADGSEPEVAAIRSALDYRGVPYDMFVATTEPPLTADRLSSADGGLYQAIILASSSLSVSGGSALDASEWAVLADYETRFRVRRAVLNAWPDPVLGFGAATSLNTTTTPLPVQCTPAGEAVFRDVNCAATQQIEGAQMYLAMALGSALTPLLTDTAGNGVADVYVGMDGRESLLLTFANASFLLHSQLFLQGVIGWVSGGTYLGDRRIDLSVQIDDLFLASTLWGGGTYRLTAADLNQARDWALARRAQVSTPDFRVAFAFNGALAGPADPLTQAAMATAGDWHWINHTFDHASLDAATYTAAHQEFVLNQQAAATLGLTGFDVRNLVTPGVSGLVNSEAMRAAVDVGIRFAVTDTSRAGCGNPSPNTAAYNAIAPDLLLVPRRPTNLFVNVSTPAQWVAEYNSLYSSYWGRDSTYSQVLDQESDVLLHYLVRGETDPWMFHQANLRAYAAGHSLLTDLIDATLSKLAAHSTVVVRTPPMEACALRFTNRTQMDGAGVRATLFRGRALVIDAAQPASVAVTGLRAAEGEYYGGDWIGSVSVVPGASTCVPLDGAGAGCTPAPLRQGGPGAPHAAPLATCDGSGAGSPKDAGPGADAVTTVTPDAPPVVAIDAPPVVAIDAPVVAVDAPVVAVDAPPIVAVDAPPIVEVDAPPIVEVDAPPVVEVDAPPVVAIDAGSVVTPDGGAIIADGGEVIVDAAPAGATTVSGGCSVAGPGVSPRLVPLLLAFALLRRRRKLRPARTSGY